MKKEKKDARVKGLKMERWGKETKLKAVAEREREEKDMLVDGEEIRTEKEGRKKR